MTMDTSIATPVEDEAGDDDVLAKAESPRGLGDSPTSTNDLGGGASHSPSAGQSGVRLVGDLLPEGARRLLLPCRRPPAGQEEGTRTAPACECQHKTCRSCSRRWQCPPYQCVPTPGQAIHSGSQLPLCCSAPAKLDGCKQFLLTSQEKTPVGQEI